jgi:hypothetical protein
LITNPLTADDSYNVLFVFLSTALKSKRGVFMYLDGLVISFNVITTLVPLEIVAAFPVTNI